VNDVDREVITGEMPGCSAAGFNGAAVPPPVEMPGSSAAG
jgi:hypothetical protein